MPAPGTLEETITPATGKMNHQNYETTRTTHEIAGDNGDGLDASVATATNPTNTSKRKAKILRCQYCTNTFHRLEHVQRHERTHTKEKPFSCACGKSFGRRDLLLRHRQLVHDEPVRKSRRSCGGVNPTPSMGTSNPQYSYERQERQRNSTVFDTSSQIPLEKGSGEWTSGTSATVLANISPQQPSLNSAFGSQHANIAYAPSSMGNTDSTLTWPTEIPEDYNFFFDDLALSSHYLPATVFNAELPISLWFRPENGAVEYQNISKPPLSQTGHDHPPSRLGSRLSSLRPEEQNLMESEPSPQADLLRPGPPWKIFSHDYQEVKSKVEEFTHILPKNFSLPSRHTLSRYLEGYISGFHQHLPFLHAPTFSISKYVPELILAIAAVGAQYRFECNKGTSLWYAARAVAEEQIRRRQNQGMAQSAASDKFSAARGFRSEMPDETIPVSSDYGCHEEAGRLLSDPRSAFAQARIGTIQALLVLMAMGMWGLPDLLRGAVLIQNQLALLVREQGLSLVDMPRTNLSWEDWIYFESDCRTKCLVYCFFNLHSIAYDTPPLLLTSEIKTSLPQSAESWRATSAEDWLRAQQMEPQPPLSFHHVLSRLFTGETAASSVSSLGNYVLIHAVIQQIYFVRQASGTANPITRDSGLHVHEIEKFGEVLRLWQVGWEQAPESSLNPSNPYGPVAFSSTTLLRLAHIRLHCDFGPCRKLNTREPQLIAGALKDSGSLVRSALLNRAVLQAAHALSIPVKLGINFVAHTQTLLWSMQHSLGNLECAVLLSKWLQEVSSSLSELSSDELGLLEMVRSIVDETDYAISVDEHSSADKAKDVRRLGVAVVRIWAATFTGLDHVFSLVKVIGKALETYADHCDAMEAAN